MVADSRRCGSEAGHGFTGQTWAVIGGVALVTMLGLIVRLHDLQRITVSLSIDEARLVLVSQGILDHGWPVLPSGRTYTRGLPVAVSVAGSLAALGQSDVAARLPSVLFGTALIPVVALHAARLGSPLAAIPTAVLVALYHPLVLWSRQAWFFSLFVLLWMVALLGLDSGLSRRSRVGLIVAGGATALGLITHELFATLLPCWALTTLWLGRNGGDSTETRRLLRGPVLLVLTGMLALAAFTLTNRADTLVGRFGEVQEYLNLTTDLAGFRFYGRMLADRYWLLAIAAIIALALRPEPRRLSLLFAVLPLFVVDAFILPDRPQERYGLALVPPMFVLGMVGLTDITAKVRAHANRFAGAAAGIMLIGVIPAIHLDIPTLIRRTDASRASGTWLADLYAMGYQPGDLIATDMPTVTQVYLGRTDFWLVSKEFEKYAFRPDGQLREIHTGGLIVRSAGELERLVRDGSHGQTVWVIGSDRSYQWQELVDRSLRRAIDEQSSARMQSADTTRIFRLQ